MKETKPDNKNRDVPDSNPAAAARRRMIRALGGSSALALSNLAVHGWQKPVVSAAVLPAHAQSSPACQIGVSFSYEDVALITRMVCIEILGSAGTLAQGCTTLPTAPSAAFNTTTGMLSANAAPGSYMVSFLWAPASGSLAYTVSCCGGIPNINTLDPPPFGPREDSVGVVVIDDGECSVNTLGP